MSEQWDFYFCNVDDKPASISLDLGVAEIAPVSDLPHMVYVRVYMRSPRPDGLSSSDEAAALFAIEDALGAAITKGGGAARGVGRCTSDGCRDLYFYAADGDACRTALEEAMSRLPDYGFEAGTRPDPEWSSYFDFLYPSERDRQRMADRRLLEVLASHGDRTDVVREVVHWIHLGSSEDREALAREVAPLGYRELRRQESSESDLPFTLVLANMIDMHPTSVDDTTLELLRLASERRGRYDGWETQVQ
ncbi:MAG: DUF695 domain-containing protein [Planctomycetota bacterium]